MRASSPTRYRSATIGRSLRASPASKTPVRHRRLSNPNGNNECAAKDLEVNSMTSYLFPDMSSGIAEVLPTHTPALFAAAVARASAALRAGEIVALPTETVYGLAANALDPAAVAKIYALKDRPPHNPIILHVASRPLACACASHWPQLADQLGEAFWPGPLTLVVPKAAHIPDIVTAGGPTVGIRWPQHPFMQAVIRACGFPLAAPSANLSNQLSPTAAAHVVRHLGHRLSLIVDGGDANVGIESTVVDVSGISPRILRPGMIDAAAIAKVVGTPTSFTHEKKTSPDNAGAPLRSPGLLAKHYSPRARLHILQWTDELDLQQQLRGAALANDQCWILAHTHVPLSGAFPQVSIIPHDPEAYARALYGELHRCDDANAKFIIIEAPPEGHAWEAIKDRLRRAAA